MSTYNVRVKVVYHDVKAMNKQKAAGVFSKMDLNDGDVTEYEMYEVSSKRRV